MTETEKLLCAIINHNTEGGPVADENTLKYFKLPHLRKLVTMELPKVKPKYIPLLQNWLDSNPT